MLLMLLIFSAISAIIYKAGASYISNTAIAQKYSGSYAGQVGVLTVTFFAVLLLASVGMNLISKSSPVKA